MHVYSIQNQGILSDASLLAMAIEDLKTVCQNSTNLEDTAISYVTGAAHDQYKSAQSAAEKCIQNGTDPLSQNFYVDAKTYPNGLFVSSVDLFFATKDATIPVNVRIRPTVNGYPDASNDIPGSLVFKNPSEVTVPAGSVTSAIGSATNFAFDYPIYLQPGQYTLMIATNSDQYTMYASKLGQVQYGTNNTVSQLNYLGSLFKSQNSSTWVAAPGETLAFNMNICDFSGGTAVVDITSETSGEVDYDLMKLTTNDMTFTGLDSINYSVLTRKLSDNSQSTSNVVANQNYNFSTRQKQSSSGDITVRATLTNTDRWTSPVIDLERLNTILVTNNISTYSSADTVAESLGGIGYGTASARYITRRITLNNNFDSTGLTVFMDVNRQPGTKIEVYYKVMNALDNNNFDDQSYVLMNPILTPESGVGYTGPSDWISDTYQSLGITYNDITTGVTYDNFKVFAIKVVFYSDNPSFVPQIKNFRTVATA
jgi:hypothetical protein